MKVTVAFGEMKIVVPCGSGDFSVKDLAAKAVYRMKHSLKVSSDFDKILVHSLSISRDGGILDWDDLVSDVLDDREQLVAQYSIESSLPGPTFSPPKFQPTPSLAPLIFELSRIQRPHTAGTGSGDPDPSSSGGGGVLMSHIRVGHSGVHGAAGSSSSSLSLSSGSLGGGGHQHHHHHHRTPHSQDPFSSTQRSRAAELPDHHSQHLHQHHHSLAHQQPLNEIVIPPQGIFEDQNKADSGYKSDHTRLFCDLPSSNSGDAGRQNLVTPPLPPPIVFDYEKNSLSHQQSTHKPLPESPTDNEPNSEGIPVREANNPVMEKLSEVLSRRRAHLRSSWDYEKNDYIDNEEEIAEGEEGDDEDDVDEDDFMEVSDAISGKANLETPAMVSSLTTPGIGEMSTVTTTSSCSGKRSTTTNTTDGEGGNFSDEGLSTVRRVVQLPSSLPKESNFSSTPTRSPYSVAQTSKNLEPLISFAVSPQKNCPSRGNPNSPVLTDRQSHRPHQHQTVFTDNPRNDSPSRDRSIPTELSRDSGSKMSTANSYQNQPPIGSNSKAPTAANAFESGQNEEELEVEEAEAEEDYPMLRLDYRLKGDGQDAEVAVKIPPQPNAISSQPVLPDEPQPPPRSSHRGLTTPAVLQWLESTQAATAAEGCIISPFATPSSVMSGTSSLAQTLGGGEDETISASQHDLVSRVIRRNVREASEDLRRGFFLSGYESEPVNIRLTNNNPGENLGIQIKPIFTEPTEIIPFVGEIPLNPNSNGKCEAGLEVHAIMPNGRVAREGILAVGDRILSINGTSLICVPFDKGREIFQEALKNPELTLQVLPYTGKITHCPIPSTNETCRRTSPPLPTREVGGPGGLEGCEKPSCGLVVVVDNSGKGKEAIVSKPSPPPPPRRSPHTALSQQQRQQLQQAEDAAASAKNVPVLPPRQKQESKGSNSSIQETKTVRLRKGASGLGFSLTSRDQHQRKPNCPVFIKNILPGGAALLDGNLKPGDRLLMVDDKDVSELGQTATVALLREKPIGSIVTLVVIPWIHREQSNPPTFSTSDGDGAGPSQNEVRKVEEDSLKYFAFDPKLVKLHTFEISVSGSSSTESKGRSDVKTKNRSFSIPTSLLASAFTLGVSVRVRPLNSDDCSESILENAVKNVAATTVSNGTSENSKDDCSRNGVFVRTVIPGGAAHKDGRLQVGDRLLAINNHSLSRLSSADALALLKTSISQITADREPFIRLLVARRLRGVDIVATPSVDPPQTSIAEDPQNAIRGLNPPPNLRRGDKTNSGSLDSLLFDAANRLNSFVVSANVHQTAQDDTPQPSTSTSEPRQQSSAFIRNQNTFLHVQQPTLLRKYSSLEALLSPKLNRCESETQTESQDQETKYEQPLLEVNAIPSDSIKGSSSVTSETATFFTATSGTKSGRIYRCDSQGTVDTTESDSTTLNDLSGLAIDEDQLSDSSDYDILAVETSKPFGDEHLLGGALSEPEMLPSLQRRRYRRRRRRTRRHGDTDRRQRTVVVVKQPKIDLDKMMVIAFDKIHATDGAQESVAVQTSPLGEESKEVNRKEISDGQKRNAPGRGTGFWRKGKTNLDDKASESSDKSEAQLSKRHYPSEGALKKLLRFVKPSGRSNSDIAAPATRIFSGRTLDRGTVAYTSSQHPSLRIPVPGDVTAAPVQNLTFSGAPTSRFVLLHENQHQRTHFIVDTDGSRVIIPRAWNSDADSALLYANTTPIQAFQTSLAQKALNHSPANPIPQVSEQQTVQPTLTKTTLPDGGNYVSLGRRQNYAELTFSPAPSAVVIVPSSADSTLAHIPPPMATLSLSKLKSVLSSCPQNQQTSSLSSEPVIETGVVSPTGTLVPMTPATNSSGGTINQLYDMNLSCCSNAYESVSDIKNPKTSGLSDTASSKSDRKVYEDAEALYRHLSNVKVLDEVGSSSSMPNHHSPPEPTSTPHSDAP